MTTIYKTQEMEWDAVYLMCVDSLEFPSDGEDTFRDELYFLPGRAPVTEALKALERIVAHEGQGDRPTVSTAEVLEQARLEYIAERLRLLYVGITRARRDLSPDVESGERAAASAARSRAAGATGEAGNVRSACR